MCALFASQSTCVFRTRISGVGCRLCVCRTIHTRSAVSSHSVNVGTPRRSLVPDCKIESKTTKAGLPWCPIEGFTTSVPLCVGSSTSRDVCVGPIKLDLTFRVRDTHCLIQEHVRAKMKELFTTDEQKLVYINKMRTAYLTRDTQAYDALKTWLRILPTLPSVSTKG